MEEGKGRDYSRIKSQSKYNLELGRYGMFQRKKNKKRQENSSRKGVKAPGVTQPLIPHPLSPLLCAT